MDLDFETLQLIQEEFQNDFNLPREENISDSFISHSLQQQFEQSPSRSYGDLVYDKKNRNKDATKSLVDPSWEVVDPTPDIHVLFIAFNTKFFWGKLGSVCVSWSKRMKRCAGICSYQGHGGLCSITLSEPLLKLRPRKDLIETLLHEMIHAYLFVTNNDRDRDGHGPQFHKHMYRINKEAGTNITVYHDFHDEVELYLTHWWRCNGPCQKWKPYFGIVRRSSNRAPGPYDRWWGRHARSCGGTYIKIKSPEPKVKESKNTKYNKTVDIKKFLSNSNHPGTTSSISKKVNSKSITNSNIHSVPKPTSSLSTSVTISSKTNNIHGFTNSAPKTSIKGATKVNSNTIVVTKKPTVNAHGGIAESASFKDSKDEARTKSQENSIDYSVVRNHWLNKFSNSEINRDTLTNNSNKRKAPESMTVAAKSTKFNEISSQDSLNCESAACPVCDISYAIEELNRHLDICLSQPKNDTKECIVCSKEIKESEFQQHVNECLDKNFGSSETPKNTQTKSDVIVIEEDSLDVDFVVCSICGNQVVVENIEEHSKICQNRTECPECGKKLDPSRFDVHLAGCLVKKFDQMENDFDNGNNNSKKIKTDTITCLVCGKYIPKNNLYSHLDECVKEVFDKDEAQTEEVEDEDDKLYNCPFCLKLISEVDMSDHIDLCLKTNGDEEAEKNKTFFLNEID